MEKRFQVTSDNRRVEGNNTIPYRYIDLNNDQNDN
jgi:hypothetical protein